MRFNSILYPSDLDTLSRVFGAHCMKFGICSEDARRSVAERLLALYQHGVTDDAALAEMMERAR